MTPKKIYISGKITGTDDYMQRFENAERELQEVYPGASVVNPAKVNAALPIDTTYEQYMDMSFVMLGMCDAIYFLKGWEKSSGAIREQAKASELGIKLLYEKKLVAVDIDWDLDSGNDEDLPKEVEIPGSMTDTDEISEYLSCVTGFCHNGFKLREEKQ